MTPTDPLFPEAPRVLYEHSPLVQVICQLRFPPILRIESSAPAEFQERVRGSFPFLERGGFAAMPNIPAEVLNLIGQQASTINYIFKSEDGESYISLMPDSIAFTSKKYQQWEAYHSNLSLAINALSEIYKPSFYTRVGLRYVNHINRTALGIADVPWSALIRNELLGEAAFPQWEERVEETRRVIRVGMKNDTGAILLQHGIDRQLAGPNLVYVVDFDFYRDTKTEDGDVRATIEKFHQRSGRAFRWTILPRLHDALGPRPI